MAAIHRMIRYPTALRIHLSSTCRTFSTPGDGGGADDGVLSAKDRMAGLLASVRKDAQAKPVKPRLDLSRPKPPTKRSKEEQQAERKLVGLDDATAKSIAAVTKAVGGGAGTQMALLAKLQETGAGETRGADIKDMLSSLAKEEKSSVQRGRGGFSQMSMRTRSSSRASINIFGAKPLGIFPVPSKIEQAEETHSMVDRCQERSLQYAIQRAPSNWYEEMAQWTEEGKTWPFPIDNELGMEEEASVGFHEHVFIQRHLEPWCPKGGPIRHHMELVCHGLSINPYMTVQRKHAIIDWHRDFFEENRETLESVGAYPKLAEASA